MRVLLRLSRKEPPEFGRTGSVVDPKFHVSECVVPMMYRTSGVSHTPTTAILYAIRLRFRIWMEWSDSAVQLTFRDREPVLMSVDICNPAGRSLAALSLPKPILSFQRGRFSRKMRHLAACQRRCAGNLAGFRILVSSRSSFQLTGNRTDQFGCLDLIECCRVD